ncbi:MAG: tRNA (adenosine(37)-N6)-dimethylallyltransferase MiaA [Chthoniobacterales bacterium]|nr:tRNA (adenosine(37)-N6)-dimethylallyltransferase MiaA [Chthoniobacterales bacterium]
MNKDHRSLFPSASSLQPPAFVIVGPTSVGKSTLSIELARRLGGEIVGVDAFQLYRGLPILTAQSPSEVVPQHLVGILSAEEECDAMRYCSMALPAIDEISSRGKIPLFVGGTGFYLRALLSPLDPLPTADATLRAQFAAASHQELLAQLEQLDPGAPSQIDTNNRRRLERALEIILLTGKPLAEVWKKNREASPLIPGIFLTRDREDLYQRIETHVHLMFDQGVLDEVAALGPLSHTATMTLGLREIQAHLRGEMTLADTIQTIIQSTKRYAKRQMTWFRNQHAFPELNLSRFSSLEAAAEAALPLLCNGSL